MPQQPEATPEELEAVRSDPHEALRMAASMLACIANGHSFDQADYLLRLNAIIEAQPRRTKAPLVFASPATTN